MPLAQVASGRTWRPPGEAGGAARAEGKGTHDATPRHGLPVAVVIRRMGFAAFFASPARFKLKPGEGDFTQRKRKGRKAGRRQEEEGECPCARQQWQWLFLAARRGSGGRDSASCSLWIFERGPRKHRSPCELWQFGTGPTPTPVQGRRNMHRRNGGTRRRRGTT